MQQLSLRQRWGAADTSRGNPLGRQRDSGSHPPRWVPGSGSGQHPVGSSKAPALEGGGGGTERWPRRQDCWVRNIFWLNAAVRPAFCVPGTQPRSRGAGKSAGCAAMRSTEHGVSWTGAVAKSRGQDPQRRVCTSTAPVGLIPGAGFGHGS